MRALFLGSGGRVGRLLKAAWCREDVTPTWHSRASLDILVDQKSLRAAIADCDVVVNLAGATHHGTTKVRSANTELAQVVLDNAQDTPVFLLSSAAIYGSAAGALTEDKAPTPVSDYGRDKAATEAMAHAHPAKSTVLRLGNVAGADALLGVERERYTLDRFPDGSFPCRSYIGPKQLADTLAHLILKHRDLPPILNVAAPRAVSMRDLLDAAGRPWDAQVAGPTAIAKVELDTSRLEAIVPLQPASAASIVQDWRLV